MRCTKVAVLTEQLELLERPPELTRAAARKLAMEAAHARAALAADAAGARADAAHPDWCELAAEKLRMFARAQGGDGLGRQADLRESASAPSACTPRLRGRKGPASILL